MNQSPRPNKKSSNNLYKNFLIDAEPQKLSKSITEIDSKLEHLDARIQKIVEAFPVNNMPLMEFVLNFTQDPEELEPFAKGLTRAAVLLKAKKELYTKRTTLASLKDHPSWFMGELNDFSVEIEEMISTTLEQSEE